jgi:hypothetical protein
MKGYSACLQPAEDRLECVPRALAVVRQRQKQEQQQRQRQKQIPYGNDKQEINDKQ